MNRARLVCYLRTIARELDAAAERAYTRGPLGDAWLVQATAKSLALIAYLIAADPAAPDPASAAEAHDLGKFD